MSLSFEALQNFLLVFSALFSIVNPLATALIFAQVTADRSHAERRDLAGRIGVYSVVVMMVALWGGSYVLNFFGISLAALRIAGGLVVAVRAWELLGAPEQNEERKQRQAGHAAGTADVAFFPLTMPLTTGPGTISVAITLGSVRPVGGGRLAVFFVGASAAVCLVALAIWLSFRWSDRIVALLGQARSRIVTRLAAFLLLCIGTQIMLTGVTEALTPIFERAA